MQRRLAALGAGALVCVAIACGGELCQFWSEGTTVGVLDSALVSEASGLVASREIEGRFYHINDSGGGPFVYVSAADGSSLRRLHLDGLRSVFDPEALTSGGIGGEPMLIVGDIGDNSLVRGSVELFALSERKMEQSGAAAVSARVAARYPDGPHNAEAMAMGPDGALYVFTKSWTTQRRDPAPSGVYRLGPEVWTHPSGEAQTFERIGQIDLPALATRERALFSDVATDAAMTADGARFLLLTYGYAWEFALDLSSGKIPPTAKLKRGRDYQLIRLKPMLGKETITYLPGDRSFLFGKEFKPDSRPSELIRMDCLDPEFQP